MRSNELRATEANKQREPRGWPFPEPTAAASRSSRAGYCEAAVLPRLPRGAGFIPFHVLRGMQTVFLRGFVATTCRIYRISCTSCLEMGNPTFTFRGIPYYSTLWGARQGIGTSAAQYRARRLRPDGAGGSSEGLPPAGRCR